MYGRWWNPWLCITFAFSPTLQPSHWKLQISEFTLTCSSTSQPWHTHTTLEQCVFKRQKGEWGGGRHYAFIIKIAVPLNENNMHEGEEGGEGGAEGRLFSKCTYKVQRKAQDHGFIHMEGVTQSCKNVRLTTALHEPLCINSLCSMCFLNYKHLLQSRKKIK